VGASFFLQIKTLNYKLNERPTKSSTKEERKKNSNYFLDP